MGEMADAIVESGVEDYRYEYYHDKRPGAKRVTCKYCGKKGLHWEQLESGKWWLFSKGSVIHKCYADKDKLPTRFPLVKL